VFSLLQYFVELGPNRTPVRRQTFMPGKLLRRKKGVVAD